MGLIYILGGLSTIKDINFKSPFGWKLVKLMLCFWIMRRKQVRAPGGNPSKHNKIIQTVYLSEIELRTSVLQDKIAKHTATFSFLRNEAQLLIFTHAHCIQKMPLGIGILKRH